MTDFLKRNVKVICIAAVIVTLMALGFSIYCGVAMWRFRQPKFRDVTIELGSDSVEIGQFLTDYADAGKVSFTSSAAQVDLNELGDHEMTLRHGEKLETVTLHIEDTTAPEVEFIKNLTKMSDYVPDPQDFVADIQDYSETTVSFEEDPVLPEDHSNLVLTVVVRDAAGNETKEECTVELGWLRESVTLELGQTLTKADLLTRPELDGDLVSQQQLDFINMAGVGTYTVTAGTEEDTRECIVTVQDTQGPELVLKTARTEVGAMRSAKDFVRSVADHSGEVELRLMTELQVGELGFQTVVIEAEDIYGNITRGETTLQVTDDLRAPVFRGLSNMKVAVYSTPDYMAGVTARDNKDGFVEFTVNDSGVKVSTPGVYTAIYTARDAAGNTTTATRKVEVSGDVQNPDELVKKLAAELSDDPEEIRNYIRSHIGYSHDWGEGNPVVYGLTRFRGNCYVHAMCLQAIFNEKGIENQLIWVNNKTHYWLIVKIDGVWRHIDPTPSPLHSRYSLMTDEQRLSTLSGRVWDTSAWPACE